MNCLPQDIFIHITKFLPFYDLISLESTNKFLHLFIWKGPFWNQIVKKSLNHNQNGKIYFKNNFFKCKICKLIYNNKYTYENYIDNPICIECLASLFICVTS